MRVKLFQMLPRPLQLKICTTLKPGGGPCFIRTLPARSSQIQQSRVIVESSCHCRVILSLSPPVLGREVHSPFDGLSQAWLWSSLSHSSRKNWDLLDKMLPKPGNMRKSSTDSVTQLSSLCHMPSPPQLRVQQPQQMPGFLSASACKRPLSTPQENSLPRTLNSSRFRSQRTRLRGCKGPHPWLKTYLLKSCVPDPEPVWGIDSQVTPFSRKSSSL